MWKNNYFNTLNYPQFVDNLWINQLISFPIFFKSIEFKRKTFVHCFIHIIHKIIV